MKLLLSLLIALALAGSSACTGQSIKQLEATYNECRAANMKPKVGPTGIVELDEDNKPVMVPDLKACEAENVALHDALERRDTRIRKEEAMKRLCGDRPVVCYGGGSTGKCVDRNGDINPWCNCACGTNNVLDGLWPNRRPGY